MDVVRNLLNILQVPCDFALADHQATEVRSFIEQNIGVDVEAEVNALLLCWDPIEPAGDRLEELLVNAISAGMTGAEGQALASSYVDLVAELEGPELSFQDARRLLSNSPLILSLALKFNKTGSTIARLLNAELGAEAYSAAHVDAVLRRVGALPDPMKLDVPTLCARDEQFAEHFFGDADVEDSIALVDSVGQELEIGCDLAEALSAIYPAADPQSAHLPYLQILYYLAVFSDKFDHRVTMPYEFAPRGQRALELFEYLSQHGLRSEAANPVLNNMKSVNQVDRGWARSKKKAQSSSAHGLVSILEGLEGTTFTLRRYLCQVLRAWTWHLIRLRDETAELLSVAREDIDADAVKVLTEWVSASNTETRGIVEQRYVDAFSSVLHKPPTWTERGIGDAVNATNLSRKKIGDSEFQNAQDRKVVGYEPHGGVMRDRYVDAHLLSLRKVVRHRRESEWDYLAGPAEWKLRVVFVAQEIEKGVEPREIEVEGITTLIEFTTYQELADDAAATNSSEEIAEALEQYFFGALDREQTPESVRQSVRTALGLRGA